MAKLEDLKPGLPSVDPEPAVSVTGAAVASIGEEAVRRCYRTPDGTTSERTLGRLAEGKTGGDGMRSIGSANRMGDSNDHVRFDED